MSSSTDLAIAPGSLIVVTGANGFIASHVVDQLLQAGYRVRGTVRSTKRGGWTVDYFNGKYGAGKFELIEVPEMGDPGAFDEAVKGAAGYIQMATPVMESYDPNVAVPNVVNGVLNGLKAAASEPSIKRFVMTSSSTAAASPQPNKEFSVTPETWNDEVVKQAWIPPYKGVQKKLDVYTATKTESEKAAWKWVKENKPGFVLNAVLPNANMGKVLDVKGQGAPSTVGWIKALWDGFEGNEDLKENPPQYFVNVQDTARVHVGALLYPDVNNERLFAWAAPYNWNDILAILRKLYPDREFIQDIPDLGRDLSKVANERAEELVKRFGRPGWTSLEDSIRDAAAGWA
jgi:nucleoside-diphosphate-sugar epimerase